MQLCKASHLHCFLSSLSIFPVIFLYATFSILLACACLYSVDRRDFNFSLFSKKVPCYTTSKINLLQASNNCSSYNKSFCLLFFCFLCNLEQQEQFLGTLYIAPHTILITYSSPFCITVLNSKGLRTFEKLFCSLKYEPRLKIGSQSPRIQEFL